MKLKTVLTWLICSSWPRFLLILRTPQTQQYGGDSLKNAAFFRIAKNSQKKPGYHGTGSAFRARAASKASDARARRSQQTLQAETDKKHQEKQEPPRARHQEQRDSEAGHSRGGLAAARSLGALSWGRFVSENAESHFACGLAASLRAFRPYRGKVLEEDVGRKKNEHKRRRTKRKKSEEREANVRQTCGRNCFEKFPKKLRNRSLEA